MELDLAYAITIHKSQGSELFLSDELVSNEKAIRRFLSEARMLAGLEHRHICRVYDIGQASDGTWYIAMAYYEGGTLKHVLGKGPLETELALEYARQTARGLAHAHDQGIVHRDIKPANLIITREDTSGEERVKILDFGVARLLGSTQYTAPGAVVGTFGYLAPEQTRGDEVTTAADIWSVGVVLFEMITGKLPFPGDSHGAQLYAIAHSEPATLPMTGTKIEQGCAAIVERCLQKNPKDRFASANELAAALGSVLGKDETVDWPSPKPPPKPRRLLVALLTAVVVLLGAFYGPRLLESIGIGGSGIDDKGVAVLPFTIVGPVDEAGALGQGLAWYLNNQLITLDGASDAFWVVPPGDVQSYKIRTKDEVLPQLGVHRIVTGSGGISGSDIALRLNVYDHRTGTSQGQDFRGSMANLKTWQQDLAAWVAGVLDPDFPPEEVVSSTHGCTSVPAAFMAYCQGVGVFQQDPDDDETRTDALAGLARAVAADSSFARARAMLGYLQWQRYDWRDSLLAAEGRAHVEAAVRLDSTLVRAHFCLGRILAAEGNYEQALAAFDRGLEFEPENPYTLQGRATALADLDRPEEAVETLLSYIEARPGYVGSYRVLGYYYYSTGQHELAHPFLVRMTEVAPSSYHGFYYVGANIAYGELDDDAEAWFRRSLAIKETSISYNNLGTLYYMESRYEDAVMAYKNALALSPDGELYVHNLAEAYRWSPGFEDSAKVIYERAIKLTERDLETDPANVELLAGLASYHSLLGHEDEARELLARLDGLPPADGNVAVTVATVYEDLGERDKALAVLEHALATGGARRMIEEYPGFRNLRSDKRYPELMKRQE